MKKRGNVEFGYVIMELLFAIFIVALVAQGITSWKNYEAFQKIQFAKDLSIQANALYSLPGNALVVNENTKEFSAEFIEGSVKIYEKKNEVTPGRYYYIGTDKGYFEKTLLEPTRIILVKNGDKVEVEEKIPQLNKLICPKVKTKDKDWKNNYKIFIDPAHGGSIERPDPGIQSDELTLKKESLIILRIAESIKALNDKIELTRDYDTFMSTEERKEKIKDADITISIGLWQNPKEKNTQNDFKAYIPLESSKKLESEKLACLILNSLGEKIYFDTLNILPPDTKNPKPILENDDKIIVYLELGNINNKEWVETVNKLTPISKAINQGIIEYFENE